MAKIRYFEYEGEDAVDVIVHVMLGGQQRQRVQPAEEEDTPSETRIVGFQPNPEEREDDDQTSTD